MWGGTNLSKQQRLGLAGSLVMGDNVASNLQNLGSMPGQNKLHASSTIGRGIVGQPRDHGITTGAAPQQQAKAKAGSGPGGFPHSHYDLNMNQ